MSRFTIYASGLSLSVLLLASCGGGNDGGAPAPGAPAPGSNLVMVSESYPNGQKKFEGTVQAENGVPIIDGSGNWVEEGGWTFWFANGQVQFVGTFDDGAVDDSRYWREYNENGSVRDDYEDE